MQFQLSVGEGPLPLRFGATKAVVDAQFAGFEIPSAYRGRNVTPQNAIGAYPTYDEQGLLWCVEMSPRCSLKFRVSPEARPREVFNEDVDDLAAHFDELFGPGERLEQGILYQTVNAYAGVSAGKIASLLVFNDEYRKARFERTPPAPSQKSSRHE